MNTRRGEYSLEAARCRSCANPTLLATMKPLEPYCFGFQFNIILIDEPEFLMGLAADSGQLTWTAGPTSCFARALYFTAIRCFSSSNQLTTR